ncbi:MAG: dihydrolipoamide acetyltransferase family protein [Sulfitobacter sp.]|nr:dihydrolipoamide acetyltransferase family protein [Sulfitobacter sp.]
MTRFVMPSLGADMEDGILVEQLVAVGETVSRGDIIAAVETQKGAIEIEVFENGILDKWLVPLGTRVPVGTPIAEIRSSDAPMTQVEPDVPQPVRPVSDLTRPKVPKLTPLASQGHPDKGRQRVTPAARRRAVQAGIDLKTLGRDRIITLKELPHVEKPPDAAPATGMRQAIAAAMSRSKREIPHYYLSDTIDLTAAEAFVADHNADLPPEKRLLIGALFIRAIANTVKTFPEFSGTFENNQFVPSPKPHVGMAISQRGGGLVAPALHDAETGSLDDLMVRLRGLIERVRQGRLRARELSDPTITLTSLGDRGVSGITGVIFSPQVAIIGIGTPDRRPVVQDGEIVARRIATVTLAADHRVSDGHRGARFLRAIISHLQRPKTL